MLVDNVLLRTGGGTPSPVYGPELAKLNGFALLPPSMARATRRPRALEHLAHTPAMPLPDRHVPSMPGHAVQAFPQTVVFAVSLAPFATEFHTSPLLPTPSTITQMTINFNETVAYCSLQVVLASTVIASDAQLCTCPCIFKVAPENQTWLSPIFLNLSSNIQTQHTWPLMTPLPNANRSRIAIRVYNGHIAVTLTALFTFTIVPEA